jgi:subtilase family serine protease
LIWIAAASFGIVLILIMPAMAAWNYDGYEVKTMESRNITGDVYISYGDKSGLSNSPYTSNFNLPGGTENYSRLYVGVWGGTETKTGTLSTEFNGNDLATVNIGGKTDANPTYTTGTNVYGRGNGVWWVSYNITGNVTMGAANAATAITGGTIDGRVYAIMLVTVYSDPSEPEIQYWINEGSYNLHYSSLSYPYVQDKTFVWFNGTSITHASARLRAAYLVGTKGEQDYLYFNPPNAGDSPSENMAWDIAKYKEYQMGENDVADGSEGEYFDLETFTSTNEKPLNDLISNNNYAVFWRGHDDNNDGKIYAEFTPGNPVEGESYVGPALAVLILSTGISGTDAESKGYPDLTVSNVAVPILSTGKVNTISATIENTGKGPAYGGNAALYVDRTLVSSASVSSLGAGKNKTVDFSWKPVNEGKYILWVSADPNDAIKELHETNNNNTPLTVNVTDLTPPKLSISRPENGEMLDEDIISVSGNVEDTSKSIKVTVNGLPASLSGTGWNAMVSLYRGYNKIIVSATDGANNTATEFVEVRSGGIHSAGMESTAQSTGETNLTANETIANKTSRSFFVYCSGILVITALIAIAYRLRRRGS